MSGRVQARPVHIPSFPSFSKMKPRKVKNLLNGMRYETAAPSKTAGSHQPFVNKNGAKLNVWKHGADILPRGSMRAIWDKIIENKRAEPKATDHKLESTESKVTKTSAARLPSPRVRSNAAKQIQNAEKLPDKLEEPPIDEKEKTTAAEGSKPAQKKKRKNKVTTLPFKIFYERVVQYYTWEERHCKRTEDHNSKVKQHQEKTRVWTAQVQKKDQQTEEYHTQAKVLEKEANDLQGKDKELRREQTALDEEVERLMNLQVENQPELEKTVLESLNTLHRELLELEILGTLCLKEPANEEMMKKNLEKLEATTKSFHEIMNAPEVHVMVRIAEAPASLYLQIMLVREKITENLIALKVLTSGPAG